MTSEKDEGINVEIFNAIMKELHRQKEEDPDNSLIDLYKYKDMEYAVKSIVQIIRLIEIKEGTRINELQY